LDGSDRVLDGRDKWSAHVAVMRLPAHPRADRRDNTVVGSVSYRDEASIKNNSFKTLSKGGSRSERLNRTKQQLSKNVIGIGR